VGKGDETRESNSVLFVVHLHQIFQEGFPKDLVNPILERLHGRGLYHRPAVMLKIERHVGIGNGTIHHLTAQVAEFRTGPLQELTPNRNVKEKILHPYFCPCGPGDLLHFFQFSSLGFKFAS
jgi:hypothetical protein